MPWPPTLPPTGQTDSTSSGSGHHADVLHNRTGAALSDVVTQVDAWARGLHAVVVGGAAAATNAPASPGIEPGGGGASSYLSRTVVDVRRASQVRAVTSLTGVTTAVGALYQYSTDDGANWATLLDHGTGFAEGIPRASAWTAVPAAAKVGSLLVRIMLYGDGVADPVARRGELVFGAP